MIFNFFSFFIKWVSVISILFVDIKDFLVFVGIISVFTGTFFALRQKRMKRLIIFSSIAQVGFLVGALATNSVDGFAAIYFFLIIYILTSILVWNHVALFYNFQKEIKNFSRKMATPLFLSSLSNFFKYNGLWAFSFILMFFSFNYCLF